ncbi:N-acetyltransferase family protein [Pseudonocardia sp.]|jgi:ribosomal protein S18 acetylase RimI-like enzyme|uniref:GNAT family N-acetyltransferase n=1 Tax=Pseudonocardia sp. TaxID=60912 RepID=UPI003D10DA4D
MTTVIERIVTRWEPATDDAVEALVRACSVRSLSERFAAAHRLTPEAVLTRYRPWLLAGEAVVARVGGWPVGLLNLVDDPARPRTTDLALLVADDAQRRGVATGLLRHTLGAPARAGWTVRATVRADNRAAIGLLRGRRLGPTRLARLDPGQLTYEIAVP